MSIKLLTTAQAAERLGLSLKYVYRLCDEKKLPYIRVGTAIRFDPAELDAWIDARRVPAVG